MPGAADETGDREDNSSSVGVAEATTDDVLSGSSSEVEGQFSGGAGDLELLISTTGRPARLDLSTGNVSYSDGDRVFPVGIFGRWLIIDGHTRGVSRLPLDNLEADPEPILDIEDAVFTSVASPIGQLAGGQVWIQVSFDTGINEWTETYYLVDLDTGAVVDQQSAEGYLSLQGDLYADEGSGLINGPAGGVYQRTEDGYSLAVDGRMITADADRALVQTCDEQLSCTTTWLDRESWQPLDLIVPEPAGQAVIVPNTDWVVGDVRFGGGQESAPVMTNIVTGDTVELYQTSGRFRGATVVLPAVSAGGQWLAQVMRDPRQVELRNLITEDVIVIELEEAATWPLMFFTN